MQISYVTQFGWFKKEYSGPEEIRKDFAEFKKFLKENGVEFLFYAGSYGVVEPCMWVIKLKDIKDWEKVSMSGIIQVNPLEKTRTIFGWDYEE